MEIIQPIFLTIQFIYVLVVFWLIFGWIKKVKQPLLSKKTQNQQVSVIIPMRNEELTIEKCLNSIKNQQLNTQNYEVIVINDDSEDNSVLIAQKFKKENPSFPLYIFDLLEKGGKKAALTFGIKKAQYNTIITTDADCTFHPNWLQEIAENFNEKEAKMLLAPVLFEKKQSLFAQIQALDFMSLMGTSFATHANNLRILANGANLIFDKQTFFDLNGYHGIDSTPSGDDVLLMQKFLAHKKKVSTLLSTNSIAYTEAEKTLKGFVNQRIRWSSKLTSHQGTGAFVLGLVVFLSNFSILVNLALAVVNHSFVELLYDQLCLKFVIDFLFLSLVGFYFKKLYLIVAFIPTELFNIVMIPIIAFGSKIFNYNWKNRT